MKMFTACSLLCLYVVSENIVLGLSAMIGVLPTPGTGAIRADTARFCDVDSWMADRPGCLYCVRFAAFPVKEELTLIDHMLRQNTIPLPAL
jgi:hypothetical protein